MFYENELRFLRDVFERGHVGTAVLTDGDIKKGESVGRVAFGERVLRSIAGGIAPRTVYKLNDGSGLCFIYLLLPSSRSATLVIGPYLSAPLSAGQMAELGESGGISPEKQRLFEEYLLGIPVISDDSQYLVMLNTFFERIWGSPAFSVVDVNEAGSVSGSILGEAMRESKLDDILVGIKAMEQRYAFENELIRAVSLGQIHKEPQLLSAFSTRSFEQRVTDPLRNAKNYGIIMNTLLRKAAESGGVHPVHLDRVSSDFASRIEHLPSLSDNYTLMCDMFRSYCRLVRKHSIQKFSATVQRTIIMIDSEFSQDISPSLLAEKQGVSLGYLSTLFKRETGKTVSEYIRERRMEHAAWLLSSTDMQIQTVALHCGILDLQYFSKLFKRQYELTPTEYRAAKRETLQG